MKILIVDDDANIRLFVNVALEGDETTLFEADSGAKGITIAATEQPDLILLDMMMPDMDGKTTLSKLREQPGLAEVPVIFLTAKAQSHELESYLKLGVSGIITKPFDPMTLPDEISQILKTAVSQK